MGASGLGSLLVKEGFLTEQDRVTITKTCGQGSWAFAKTILAIGLLDEDELAAFFAERTKYIVAPRDFLDHIDQSAVQVLDKRMISKLEILPLKRDSDKITVAVLDPLDRSTLKQLEFFTGLAVDPIIVPMSQLYEGLLRIDPDFLPRDTSLSQFLQNHVGAAWVKQRIVNGDEAQGAEPLAAGASRAASSRDDDIEELDDLDDDSGIEAIDEGGDSTFNESASFDDNDDDDSGLTLDTEDDPFAGTKSTEESGLDGDDDASFDSNATEDDPFAEGAEDAAGAEGSEGDLGTLDDSSTDSTADFLAESDDDSPLDADDLTESITARSAPASETEDASDEAPPRIEDDDAVFDALADDDAGPSIGEDLNLSADDASADDLKGDEASSDLDSDSDISADAADIDLSDELAAAESALEGAAASDDINGSGDLASEDEVDFGSLDAGADFSADSADIDLSDELAAAENALDEDLNTETKADIDGNGLAGDDFAADDFNSDDLAGSLKNDLSADDFAGDEGSLEDDFAADDFVAASADDFGDDSEETSQPARQAARSKAAFDEEEETSINLRPNPRTVNDDDDIALHPGKQRKEAKVVRKEIQARDPGLSSTALLNEALLRLSLCFDQESVDSVLDDTLSKMSAAGCLIRSGGPVRAWANGKGGASSLPKGAIENLTAKSKEGTWQKISLSRPQSWTAEDISLSAYRTGNWIWAHEAGEETEIFIEAVESFVNQLQGK